MRLWLLLLAFALSGCPPSTEKNDDAPAKASEPCTKFGERCEFSPGKLGTCVRREDCTGDNCFVCQSQH